MERLPEGSSRRISGRWVARYVTIGGEVRFHRADVGQLPSSFTVREAIEGIDRNRCVKPAAFFKQRRGFRNACVSDGAGFGSWPLMVYVGGNSAGSQIERSCTRAARTGGLYGGRTDTYSFTYTRTEICRYVDGNNNRKCSIHGGSSLPNQKESFPHIPKNSSER